MKTTLLDIVNSLKQRDDESTIFLKKPWRPSSEAIVCHEDDFEDKKMPGFGYFLEISIAKEFLEDWVKTQAQKPDIVQTCTRLIQYAIRDA